MQPTYTALLKIYFAAKVKYLGYRKRKEPNYIYITDKVRDLQNKTLVATKRFQEENTDLSLFLLQQLHRSLVEQYRSDESNHFHLWLTKLNSLDYAGSTKEFYARLRWKYNICAAPEPGPIQDGSGKLSRSWSQCLANWSEFYSKMYNSPSTYQLQSDGLDDPILDRPFTFENLVLAVTSLAEHKAPGADCIRSNDLTLLLRTDPSDPQFTEDNRYLLRYTVSIELLLAGREGVPCV